MKTNIGWQDTANPHKLALLDQFLAGKKGLNVLELAAGYGWYSTYLHEKGHKVTALDIDLQFQHEGIDLRTADLEQPIALADDQFDVVVAWDIIEHLKNESGIISEIKRVARRGALIFISVPHIDDSRIASSYLTYSHFKDNTHVREYTPDDLSGKFTKAGFKNINLVLKGGEIYPYVILNFIDNKLWKFVMKAIIKTFISLGIIKVKNCHGDVYAVFIRQ